MSIVRPVGPVDPLTRSRNGLELSKLTPLNISSDAFANIFSDGFAAASTEDMLDEGRFCDDPRSSEDFRSTSESTVPDLRLQCVAVAEGESVPHRTEVTTPLAREEAALTPTSNTIGVVSFYPATDRTFTVPWAIISAGWSLDTLASALQVAQAEDEQYED